MTSSAPVSEAVEVHEIRTDEDVVTIRRLTRSAAVKASLSLVDQTKVVTAASELARNVLTHGGGGVVRLEVVRGPRGPGVRATFRDDGDGIPDVDLALTDGFSTGAGLGLGLSGSRRLVDEFDLRTEVGVGTEVIITTWAR